MISQTARVDTKPLSQILSAFRGPGFLRVSRQVRCLLHN